MGKTNHNYKNYALLAILGLAVFLGGVSIYSNNLSKEISGVELGLVQGSTTRSGLVTARVTVGPQNAECMKAALGVRDESITKAFDAKNQAAVAALAVRQETQKNAWSTELTSAQRKTALKATWTAYKQVIDKAGKDYRAARKAAWAQYAKNSKFCGTAAAADDGKPSESMDSQL